MMSNPPLKNLYARLWRYAHRIARGGTYRLLRAFSLRPPLLRYENWIRDRLAARLIEYPPVRPAVGFSILTPVFDTPPRFLRQLARRVLTQDESIFEWVIVDNGSTRRGTKRVLRYLERQPCVRLIRLPKNEGIIRGTRVALEAARGEYIVPVDHDDLLHPDALRVMAYFIRERGNPAILYSDEDKLLRGQPACPFFKPDWDPALFLNCCYVTHLSALSRELALKLELYTDADAEGCPDWDAYCRFIRAGHTPVHVPEILYSWRVHPASTSSIQSQAKSYAVVCQEKILRKHLGERDELRSNPLFGHPGMWWPARRRTDGPTVFVNLVTASNAETLAACLQTLGKCDYPDLRVRIVGVPDAGMREFIEASTRLVEFCSWKGRYSEWLTSSLEEMQPNDIVVTWRDDHVPLGAEWPWEMVGLLERHPDAVAVCGRFHDHANALETGGEVFGYLGLAGSPIVSPHFPPGGYHGLLFCQRTVSVVTPQFFAARAGFLAEALGKAPAPSWETLGLWLGAHARHTGRRVLYSPHIVSQRQQASDWPHCRADEEVLRFLQHHSELLANDPYYGRHLSLKPGEGYLLTTPKQRDAVLRATLSRLQGLGTQTCERVHPSPNPAFVLEAQR